MVKFITPRGMRMPFGKHKGKLIEWLLLKEPFSMQFMICRLGQENDITQYANNCIKRFNDTPFILTCEHENEDGTTYLLPITLMSVYVPADIPSSLIWFCELCWKGFDRGNGAPVRTYEDAIRHGESWFHGTKRWTNMLLEYMYNAKGLSERLSAEKLIKFYQD